MSHSTTTTTNTHTQKLNIMYESFKKAEIRISTKAENIPYLKKFFCMPIYWYGDLKSWGSY